MESAAPQCEESVAETAALDEDTLVARAQDRDVEAFEELVIRYENRLYRFAYGMVGNRADAEDILQESLLRTWRSLPSLTVSGAFSGWVYRITTRQCLDLLARRQTRATDPFAPEDFPHSTGSHDALAPPGSPDPVAAAETRHQMEELTHQLQHLPPGQRACWLLREVHQCSYHQIAAALSIPESTVRGRLTQARTQLAKGMTPWR